MANEKTPTLEKVIEKTQYFKASEKGLEILQENQDYSIKTRRLTSCKKLQDYVDEARKFRENNPKSKVVEKYTRNGNAVNLNDLLKGNDILAILKLLSLEVASCIETREREVSTGGIIEKEIRTYEVDLY